MSLISIRLDDDLIKEVKDKSKKMHLSQTQYIRQAIEKMNAEIVKHEQALNLMEVSQRVRAESMKVNQEFADIEYDPET